MSLQVVRILIGVFVSIGKIHPRIGSVVVEPAFHFTLITHNYLQFFVDFSLLLPQFLVVLLEPPQFLTDLVCLASLIISPFGIKQKTFTRRKYYARFCTVYSCFYLILMRVARTFSESISLIEYLAEAIITSVPILTASLTYSSFAFAPFAPARDAPLQ